MIYRDPKGALTDYEKPIVKALLLSGWRNQDNGLSPWLRRGLSPAFHRVVYAAARPVELAARRNPSLLQRDLMQRDKPFRIFRPCSTSDGPQLSTALA
jgi:hypothetical protein